MAEQAPLGPYFNLGLVPENAQTLEKYVCWLDVMGTSSVMARSLPTGANFVMKLHRIVMEQLPMTAVTIECFPAVDGVYLLSDSLLGLSGFTQSVLLKCADEFLSDMDPKHQFMPRGGLAHGRVARGSDYKVGYGAGVPATYADAIVLGPALTDAYRSEALAPPFGVYVHESARHPAMPMNSRSLSRSFLRFWPYSSRPDATAVAGQVHAGLLAYFDWAEMHATELAYAQEAIRRHRTLAKEYFHG